MTRLVSWLFVGAALLGATACKDPVLEQKVADLEAKVAELEGKAAAGPARAAPNRAERPQPTEEDKKAGELLRDANQAYGNGDWDVAKAKLSELQSTFGSTDVWSKYGARLQEEVNVIGKDAGKMSTEKWFSDGKAEIGEGKLTFLVFWEEWCPHCRKEMPSLQERYDALKGKGVNLIGVTKVSGRATDEKVDSFIESNNLQYPIAKETGEMSSRFAVSGVPAAALVKGGKVVWRGHPRRVTDDVIEKYL